MHAHLPSCLLFLVPPSQTPIGRRPTEGSPQREQRRQRLCVNLPWEGIVHSPRAARQQTTHSTTGVRTPPPACPALVGSRSKDGQCSARVQSDELLEQTLGLVVPAPSAFGSQYAQALWPPEGKVRVARTFASRSGLCAAPSRSAAPRVGLPSRPSRGHERRVIAEGFAALGGAINDAV